MLDHTQMVRGERAPAVYALSGLGRQRGATQLVHTTGLVLASCADSARAGTRALAQPHLDEDATVDVYPITDLLLLVLPDGNHVYAESLVAFTPRQAQSILPMLATRRQHRGQQATASTRATGGDQLSFTRWRSARSISTMRPRGCMEPG